MKTSKPSWAGSLSPALARTRTSPDDPGPVRLAVLGIGSELNGDDAAGGAVVRGLAVRFKSAGPPPRLLLIESGPAPENATSALRRFRPDLVLMVDAAVMDRPPGTVDLLDWRLADGFSASTHTLPLSMTAAYLESELNCQVLLLAIQAARLDFAAPLSAPVKSAVWRVVREIFELVQSPV